VDQKGNGENIRIRGVVNLVSMWVFGVFFERAKRRANVCDPDVKNSENRFHKKNFCKYFQNRKNFYKNS